MGLRYGTGLTGPATRVNGAMIQRELESFLTNYNQDVHNMSKSSA